MDPVIKSTGADASKNARILAAARVLFMSYGLKRTSIDDVAREAGIAKGTLYLYFASKEELFAAVAERFCGEIEREVDKAMAPSHRPVADRIVAVLDARVGAVRRLLAESPHVAELYESKKTTAAVTVTAHQARMHQRFVDFLHREGVGAKGAAGMFEAAAIGALHTGDMTANAYKARLRAIVRTLLAGMETVS